MTPEEFLASLGGRKEAEDLLLQAEMRIQQEERRKIFHMYPEYGPLARKGYRKHMAFFKAGATYQERLACCANRCVTPWTPIETDCATRLAGEMIGEKEFGVRAWDGDSLCNKRASGLFLKGILPAFHVQMDNGEAFQCTDRHRVLTSAGWTSIGHIIRSASGLHCWKIGEDFPANYDMGQGRDDRQLPVGLDIFQEQPLRPVDVPEPGRWKSSHVDEGARISQYNHVFEGLFRLPILDDQNLIGDLCAKFPSAYDVLVYQWPSETLRYLRRFADTFFLEREVPQDGHRFLFSGHLSAAENKSFDDEDRRTTVYKSIQGQDLCLKWIPACQDVQLFLGERPYTSIFFPCSHAPLMFGRKINFVVPIGLQPIIDFTVDGVNNYLSAGVISHNTGKTEGMGGYEMVCHLTGIYPAWWGGRRFEKPVRAWASGNTNQKTREILQEKLYGKFEEPGTGLIPGELIAKKTPKSGVADAIDQLFVKHLNPIQARQWPDVDVAKCKTSVLTFKSYEMKREGFEGTEQDVIWLDEEPPLDIYTECLLRLMTTRGIMMLTFTPLKGMSDVVRLFFDEGVKGGVDNNV